MISVGRFVPENNFDIMIREFMKSRLDMDFTLITTEDTKFAAELQRKYNYRADSRIKFVGTVYDTELLAKIRERAAAYLHVHEVGGTNPSLLESMGKTKVNRTFPAPFVPRRVPAVLECAEGRDEPCGHKTAIAGGVGEI